MTNNKIEYKKSVKDASGIYFIENFLMKHMNSFSWGYKFNGLVNNQKELLKSISECQNTFVVKGRQGGYSTAIFMRMIYDVVFSDGDETILLFGGSSACSRDTLNKIENMIGQVPAEMWTIEPSGKTLVKNGFRELDFFNGCKIIAVDQPQDLREKPVGVKCIYADEWLFAKNAKVMLEILRSSYGDAKFIMGSSPNNTNNLGFDEAQRFRKQELLNSKNSRIVYMGPMSKDKISEIKKKGLLTDEFEDEFYGVIKKTEVFDGVQYDKINNDFIYYELSKDDINQQQVKEVVDEYKRKKGINSNYILSSSIEFSKLEIEVLNSVVTENKDNLRKIILDILKNEE